MESLKGLVLQPGLFIGTARQIEPKSYTIPKLLISNEEIDEELQLLTRSIAAAEEEISENLKGLEVPMSDKEILNTHLLILRDPEVINLIQDAIRFQNLSAAQAVLSSFDNIVEQFLAMDNAFLAQRADDYQDVAHRLLGILVGDSADDYSAWKPDQVAVLQQVSPSQVTAFGRQGIKAYVSEQGSYTSHASILTRALGIVALSSISELTQAVKTGETLILDGIDGQLIIDPDPATVNQYRELQAKYAQKQEALIISGRQKAQTLSGRAIKLRCNLDLPEEIDAIRKLGADGIGLFRTEFLYLGKSRLPDEELQRDAYARIAESCAPHSVIIRTFDLGGDKLSHLIPSPAEENPYLGSRGIRFSLAHPNIFRTQLRAILRASAKGRVQIMFPMVNDLTDFLKAKAMVDECRAELRAEGIAFAEDIPLGVMIEVPSAALGAKELARNCDFFSIGTNDLVQYTLAADRNNSILSPYYLPHHPAVLALIAKTANAAKKQGIPVSVCGEMASQPEYVPLFIGMGINELSVSPAQYYVVKSIVRRCDQALEELVSGFDFECGLQDAEDLVYNRLKHYYQS